MLLGAEIHIHTDHKNLTCDNLSSQRVIRWRLYLEDFNPTITHIEGKEKAIGEPYGFQVTHHDMTLYGYCNLCQSH